MRRAIGWVRLGAYLAIMALTAAAFRLILGPLPPVEDDEP